MLMPKRTKFRKQMKGRNRGKATRGTDLAMGEFGIKAIEAGRINSRQIEAARVEEWVMNIKPGRIIYEMAGVNEELAREALTLAMHKLPFKTKIVTRESENEIY